MLVTLEMLVMLEMRERPDMLEMTGNAGPVTPAHRPPNARRRSRQIEHANDTRGIVIEPVSPENTERANL